MNICLYCNSKNLRFTFPQRFHHIDKNHGPFDLYECETCGALLTSPMPSEEVLHAFYSKSSEGMPDILREARKDSPQEYLYLNYVEKVIPVIRELPNDFTWLDVGAGGGEFARLLKKRFPQSKGHCIDFHSKPNTKGLEDIEWISKDLNKDFDLEKKFDVVFSFAVLEHVLDPNNFLSNIKRLTHPGSKIVIVLPKYDSLLANFLSEKWPYFSPGEHLTIPTTKSLKSFLPRYFKNYQISSMSMPYSMKYILSYLSGNRLSTFLPFDLKLPVPAGIFFLTMTEE